MTYVEKTNTTFDKLIAGVTVPVMTKNVTVKAHDTVLKRGTVLALNNGKYEIVDAESETADVKVANAVLAEDVEQTGEDVIATVYTAGLFNPEAMAVKAAGDTVLAHEEELRIAGIYLAQVL